MRLYELTEQWDNVFYMMEDGETDEQVIFDTLEAIEGEIEYKADNYAKIILNLQASVKALKAEEERLYQRRKSTENHIQRLKNMLQANLEHIGKTKFKTDLFNFSISKNGGKQPLSNENGLQVYLISDPGIDQSAASMSVEAGSWQDSEEYPGTAHFLEHMLFMGNAAYPDESEYMQYIQDNGGLVNAFTASDRTVYMFSINNDAYEGALDRFSHFFIDPLFNPSCIQRELQAVDQENSKNIENDNWREYMVFKETGNPKHPNRKFSTGNAKTLSGIPQEALKNWYQTTTALTQCT